MACVLSFYQSKNHKWRQILHTGPLGRIVKIYSYILTSHISILVVPGHYISDVYDMKKQSWLTYNDLDVSRTQEAAVQRDRDRSGYIFFYMHK